MNDTDAASAVVTLSLWLGNIRIVAAQAVGQKNTHTTRINILQEIAGWRTQISTKSFAAGRSITWRVTIDCHATVPTSNKNNREAIFQVKFCPLRYDIWPKKTTLKIWNFPLGNVYCMADRWKQYGYFVTLVYKLFIVLRFNNRRPISFDWRRTLSYQSIFKPNCR